MRLSARIAKLESEMLVGSVGYRMRDGSVKHIAGKRVYDAFMDVVEKRDTRDAQIMLAADPAIPASDGNKMHQLAQALVAPPYIPATRNETREEIQ